MKHVENWYLESEFKNKTRIIHYECGRASWHQRKAGHFYSSKLIVEHNYAQHVAFMKKRRDDYPIIAFLKP